MSIMSDAYMKMFPMEGEKKFSAGKRNPVLDVPEFNKAWNLYRDTSLDIMKRYEYMAQCVGFTDKDTEAIKESKDVFVFVEAIGPQVREGVDIASHREDIKRAAQFCPTEYIKYHL